MKLRKQKIQQNRDAKEILKMMRKGSVRMTVGPLAQRSTRPEWSWTMKNSRMTSRRNACEKTNKIIERFIILSENLTEISDCCMETEV